MPDLTPALLPQLLAHRLSGLTLEGDFLFPDYSGRSMLNLPASICQALGAPMRSAFPLAPESLPDGEGDFRNVVLLVVDGLGLEFFHRFLAERGSVWAGLLPQANLAPLTSLAPSTTATVLTTLWTGVGPLEHGIVGYEVWLREYGVVANMIVHAPASAALDVGGLRRSGFEPEAFLPVKPLGVHLEENGVPSTSFMPAGLARSGLSTMHLARTQVYPYRSLSDLWLSLGERLTRPGVGRQFLYAYWPDLDTLSHGFGPLDERTASEFELFSLAAERFFFDRLGPKGLCDTLFLLTADHGFASTPQDPHYELRNHPGLLELLHIQPTGESRLAYLYPRPGMGEAVQAYMEQAWPGQFAFVSTRQAVASGLFGPGMPSPLIASRFGDLVAIARGGAYLWWANKENHLRGRHGGLTPAEMLVPLYALAG